MHQNSFGSYGCTCNTGFSGDGKICQDQQNALLAINEIVLILLNERVCLIIVAIMPNHKSILACVAVVSLTF